MDAAIDAVVEIFTWVGFGAGVLLAAMALIIHLADGTWIPVRAVVEDTEHGRVVRWFDEDGGVNEAALTPQQAATVGDAGMYDIFARRGWQHRMRFTPGSPVVRGMTRMAVGFLALGVLALIASWVLLFVRG